MRWAAFLVFGLLQSAVAARADVIPPDYEPPQCEPLSCPRGSVGASGGHGSCPRECVPWSMECGPDRPCQEGYGNCELTRFCLEYASIGRRSTDVVRGVCAADGSCAQGTCREVFRCVPGDAPAPASAGRVGGPAQAQTPAQTQTPAETPARGPCAVSPGGRAPVWLLAAIAALLWRYRPPSSRFSDRRKWP